MAKIKTTMKYINALYNKVYRAGYCDLQYIFRYEEPTYYNCGVYGWNCDIYTEKGIAITTGYRNMRGKQIPHELIEKYSEKAKEIASAPFTTPYEEIKRALDVNRENFIDELLKL